MSGAAGVRQIAPTYLSTDLITPGKRQRVTLPVIAEQNAHKNSQRLWGNEANRKRRSSRSSQKPASTTRDPSHLHYGTKVVQMRPVTQPYTVTQLKLSGCRMNDERLPRILDDTITKNLVLPKKCLTGLNPYFTHMSKFEVFPSTMPGATSQQGWNDSKEIANPCVISENTMEALTSLHKKVCWTTTYMKSYSDPHSPKKLTGISTDVSNSKHVTFSDHVEHFDSTSGENEQLDKIPDEMNQNEASVKEDVEQASAASCDENIADDEKICRFCCKKIRKIADVKFLKENGKLERSALSSGNGDNSTPSIHYPSQKRVAWPVQNKNFLGLKPNYPKLIINGYNDKPRCQKISSLFCTCEQSPELKQSILKEEFVRRRRASSFARRNHTTISVFHLLKYDAPGAQRILQQNPPASDTILKQPHIDGWDPDYKSNAIREFQGRFPVGASGITELK